VTPTTLPPTLLPRARGLTDALLAPAGPPPPPGVVRDVCRAFRHRLAETTASHDGPPVRVDAFTVRTAGGPPLQARQPGGGAFHWTPRRARRAVGVSAAAEVVGGRERCPAQGAERAVASLIDDARRGACRPGSVGAWLGRAPAGVVAAVLAEGTAWATHFVTAVEWHRVGRPVEVGGPDRWWDLVGRPTVGLRCRVDARLAVASLDRASTEPVATGPARQSFLTMLGGRPGPTSRAELGLAALVEVLRHPGGPVPARAVGWWPACGRALVLDVGEELLTSTASAVLDAVRSRLGCGGLRALPVTCPPGTNPPAGTLSGAGSGASSPGTGTEGWQSGRMRGS
jgi:hypothetical protein